MKKSLQLLALYVLALLASYFFFPQGLIKGAWENYSFLKLSLYLVLMGHITITSMSLAFHRAHSHRGVEFHPVLDFLMQAQLWFVTGMSKLDWVSVHLYHHAHSDQEKDPHSPVQKGFWHVFLLGVWDYIKAKDNPQVRRIRKGLSVNSYESFFDRYPLLGIILLSSLNILLFGGFYGTIISLINFSLSPLFAVGGVNAMAHMWGYRNHKSRDNSRNIGFLYFLNWIICGELDHNNHHAQQRSCSFRHRWFEFDIGYVYIKILSWLKLAKIKVVYKPENLADSFRKQLLQFLETESFSYRLKEVADEFNANYEELKTMIRERINGERKKLEPRLELLIRELKFRIKQAQLFST